MTHQFKFLVAMLLATTTVACSKSGPAPAAQAAPPPVTAAPPPPPTPGAASPAQAPAAPASPELKPQAAGSGQVTAINSAPFDPNAMPSAAPAQSSSADKTAPPNLTLVKAEVLLDRANFSPGVIDGRPGTNFKRALAAYRAANGLKPADGLDQATWDALGKDAKPVAATYTITSQDEAGPFAPDVGEDFVKLAALPDGPQFADTAEMLAERFHMDENAMKALNPGVDFTKAGSVIVVAQPGGPAFAKGDVKRVEVSKAHAAVTAYGEDDKVLAVYPATVGSTERPSPSGTHKVNGVAWNTDYTYDPAKLKWGPRAHGKLHVKPGPNGPVGVVWIALNAPDYGIHGTPDPSKIGKTASHGCVRLTNWDATALAHGVHPGTVVQFVGTRGG